eukprot:gene16630-22726_t
MAYISSENARWESVLHYQWLDFHNTGLEHVASAVHVELVCDSAHHDRAVGIIHSLIPSAIITYSSVNKFEYPGILKVWDIAVNDCSNSSSEIVDKKDNRCGSENHLILYFHTKCMVNASPENTDDHARCKPDHTMFEYVIFPWEKIVTLFNDNSALNKAGLAPSPEGFIWGNFWWIRASYVRKSLEKPIESVIRGYYEYWISLVKSDQGHCCFPGHLNGKRLPYQTPQHMSRASDSIGLCPWGLTIGQHWESGGPCW